MVRLIGTAVNAGNRPRQRVEATNGKLG